MVHHDYQGRALTRRQALQVGAAGAAAAACAWARPGTAWADDSTANNKKADSSSKGALYAFRDSDSRLWGYIDKQGVVVIKPTFKEVSNNPISGPITNLNATDSRAQARALCQIADIGSHLERNLDLRIEVRMKILQQLCFFIECQFMIGLIETFLSCTCTFLNGRHH